ncbi:baseplate J/gp47 family protein [Planctomycetota bacterium]
MSVAMKKVLTSGEWDKVYDILAGAHKEKIYESRRRQLQKTREDEGFDAMIHFALGEDPAEAEASPLVRLKEFVTKGDDKDFLEDVSLKPDAEQDWDRVYRIVEIAQRIREEFPEPVAQKEEWRNLYPSENATAVSVSLGIEEDKKQLRWKTFGQPPPEANEDGTPPPPFGWAISSPLLALSEGTRKIFLTLGFQADQFDDKMIRSLFSIPFPSAAENEGPFLVEKDAGPFSIEISTEKGWISPDSIQVKTMDYPSLSGISIDGRTKQATMALQFTLTFGPDVDSIAPLPAEEAQIDTHWPVLRLMLQQIWDAETERFITHYSPFKDLILVRAHIRVNVGRLSRDENDATGLTTYKIQNDETVLDAKKPFEPFGSSPSAGSRFFLGHPELVYKRLDSLTFNIDWMGVPSDLKKHYRNYSIWPELTGDVAQPERQFTACISLVDKRILHVLKPEALLFLGLTNADEKHSIKIYNLLYERILEIPTEQDVITWNRYMQWELNDLDFQHKTYPALAAQKSIAMAAAIANKDPVAVVAATYQVNPPYTPKIKSLSLDYTSSEEIVLEEYQPGSQIDRIFHIHPFGYNEVQPDVTSQGCFFMPQYDNEGELYIGIKDVHPRQNVSILFQMAEGSADPDQEPVPIQWSYLSDNRWISLHEGNILSDSTRGLINSGIIKFKLEPVKPSTWLPKDLYWIRAAVAQHSTAVCDTVAIHTQAVSAAFVDKNNAPDHYSSPLPAETITGLTEPMPEIVSVRQPYTSYGAKMKEQENIFYTRVSERLRHKNRALTLWDYERLVLERFPQIYKAKCLPANVKDHPAVPGKVEIIIIPDIRNQLPRDPFEPRASAELIADIESYLLDKSPAYATVKARNAHYVAVKVRVGVRFKQGFDEGYYKTQLNDELNHFLSPWAYEEGKDIVIGGKIYANNIINFIDEREYVDYVAKIKLFSSEDGRTFRLAQPSESQGYFVTTEGSDGVLVAARQHEIDIISEVGYEHEEFTGINYMKIELDFIVG